MRDRGATYTLDDLDSPVLKAVIEDIARIRLKRQRRIRAGALIATLARVWNRLGEFAEVESADDYVRWHNRGPIPAYWLWQARNTEWLDDESGAPRKPSALHVRTAGTQAIYGADSPDYLHPDLFRPNWRPVLAALGVSGEPTRAQLVARLTHLRRDTNDFEQPEGQVSQDAAIVYRTLAQSLHGTASRSDLSRGQLRQAFSKDHGLILTKSGWRSPENVFGGDSILGGYRAFAPAVSGTEPLWEALGLKRLAIRDCVEVIREIARRFPVDPSDAVIVLEALRFMAAEHGTDATARDQRALRRLPLVTSGGWTRSRPVYATDDPLLSKAMQQRVAMWDPGGELEQFGSLLGPLGVRLITAADTEVIEPDRAEEEPELTEFFRAAVQQLREDLARNEPELVEGLMVPWDRLGAFRVCIHPSLMVRVSVANGGVEEVYECQVPVNVHSDRDTVFVRTGRADLVGVDQGGRALATLFKGNTRRLAYAWRGACDRADEGAQTTVLELARERAAREKRQNELGIRERLAAFQDEVAARRRSRSSGVRREEAARLPGGRHVGPHELRTKQYPSRVLVDPASLKLIDERGRVAEGSNGPRSGPVRRRHLADPGVPGIRPRNRKSPPSYTSLDKESVGLQLLTKVLGSDREEIVDLRTRRCVGADAMDDLKRFYELKVSAGGEPDTVVLTASEVRRAALDRDFFLVVVSSVEGGDAQPKVRLVLDPLRHLTLGRHEGITLSGVRTSKSLVYDFEPEETAVNSTTGEPDSSAE